MGPGLLESIYEHYLVRELELQGIPFQRQQSIPLEYKGASIPQPFKCDLLVNGCLLLELKAVEAIAAIHKAQVLSYMKLADIPLGLLINFHEVRLVDGIHRLILRGADQT
jgi:GxxExxY protein